MILETMRVLNQSGEGTMLINKTDFDPSIHKIYVEQEAKAVVPEPAVTPPAIETSPAPKKGRPFTKSK